MKTQYYSVRAKRLLYFCSGILAVALYEQAMLYSVLHKIHLLPVLTFYAIDIAYFLTAAYILYPFAILRPYRLFRILLAVIVGFVCFLLLQNVADTLLDYYKTGDFHFTIVFLRPFWRCVYLSMIALAYYFAVNGIEKAKQARALEIEKLELKAAVLRARIKPHFTFHTLQFLQSEVSPVSISAGQTLELFAEVMHYTLESDSGATTLEEELEQVTNYIHLNIAMRRLKANLIWHIDKDEHTITRFFPSMVLLNLVENIFDHGVLSDEKMPAIVNISCRDNQLVFYSRNLQGKARRIQGTGLGTAYLKTQLETMFPGRYTYRVKSNESYYEVNLKVEL
ncbi:histidine kinase [Mucilaginibacter sp. RS28]|uniref:Histidine kinase n=1 Tax=Mucilaginibacter straminoryzae TaxID=2932774 RepID=A0A9X2BBE5_9SPHI|nr:histidine kinase [Mucilaginibacter straminoryzae]MCJ8208098.1 histidine kinase [Mucilaginibacter straminoryzae]